MLEIHDLVKTWTPPGAAPRALLRGLCLQVAAGQTVAILGRSGSGKSTLLKVIAGLEPVEQGRVCWAGQDISHLPPERRQCALMFQDFALFAHLNVQDNVAFGLVEQRLPRAQARAQASAMLQRMGLGAALTQRVGTLSGGEQQRVALARALVTRPRMLLLDEPLSALDADLREHLRLQWSQAMAQQAMATIWVTHDEAEARAVGQRGYRLVDGLLQPLW